MPSRPAPERRLEAVFSTPDEKRRCMAAAAAASMNASRWAAATLLAAADGTRTPTRSNAVLRGANSLRIAALRAQRLLAQIKDPAIQETLAQVRDEITAGLAQLP